MGGGNAAYATGADHSARTTGAHPYHTTDAFPASEVEPGNARFLNDAYDYEEEAPLIEAARAGDTEAIGILFARYQLVIFGFLRRHVRSQQDAEDLTQDTMANAYAALPRLHHEHFRRWIFLIAINLYRSWCRRLYTRAGTRSLEHERDKTGFEIVDDAQDVNVWIAAFDQDPQVVEAMKALTAYQRRVVVQHFVRGLTFREIAQNERGGVMDVVIGTVDPVVERRAEALKQVSQRGKSAFIRRYREIAGESAVPIELLFGDQSKAA